MKEIKYTITFLEYWQVSSGLGLGSAVDSECLKDKHDLPYIPGKTLKGLWRDAFIWSGADESDILAYFGKEANAAVKKEESNENSGDQSPARITENISVPGKARWTNATLNENLVTALLSEKEMIPHLYTSITTTAIGENGTAAAKSLRTNQVCVPLTLTGSIQAECLDISIFHKAAAWIRRMGMGRNRGFGRCIVKIENHG